MNKNTLEYTGPRNTFVPTFVAPRHRAKPGPRPTLDFDSAQAQAGIALPDVSCDGVPLTARAFVKHDDSPDLEHYGEFQDSQRHAGAIARAKARGHLVLRARHRERNLYDTWVSAEPITVPRVARFTKWSHAPESRGWLNRSQGRHDAWVEQRRHALAQHRALRAGIAVYGVVVKLYLAGHEIANSSVWGCEFAGAGRECDEYLAEMVQDVLYEARAQAKTEIAELRRLICGASA